jgi:hypothetical protein
MDKTINNTAIENGVKQMYDTLKNMSFNGTIEIKESWFADTAFATLFKKVLQAESFHLKIGKYVDIAGNFSVGGTSTIPVLGETTFLLNVSTNNDDKTTVIDASIETVSTPKEIFPWFNSALISGISCSTFKLSFSTGKSNEVAISATIEEPRKGNIKMQVSLTEEIVSLEYNMAEPLTIPVIKSMSISDFSGKLDWKKETDFSGVFSATCNIGTVSMPITVPIPSGNSELVIKYENTTNDKFSGFNDLLKALPEGDVISGTLAPISELIEQSGLTLSELLIGLNSQTFMPQRISLSIGFLKQWSLIDSISLANPQIALSYSKNPLEEKGRINSELSAKLILGQTDLEVGANLPDTTLYCNLASNQQVPISDIAVSFGLNTKGFPDVSLTKFNLSTNIKSKSVDISAGFSSNLTFNIGKTQFELSQADFQMSYADSKCNGKIEGQFAIGDVPFSVSAATQANGWEFNGSANDKISLDSLASGLLKSSGISINSSLPEITLNQASIQWSTGDGGFNVLAQVESDSKINLGVTSLSLKGLDLDITHTNGKTTGYIKGTVYIGQIKFDVNYDFNKGPVIDANLGTVNISKIAETLCGENLLNNIGLPSGFPDFELNNCEIELSAQDASATITADLKGYAKAIFELKKSEGKWGFVFAAVISSDFKFQNLAGFLKPIDVLNFKDSALVISTLNDDSFLVPEVPGLTGEITKGLNFLMNLSMNDCSELQEIHKILHLHINTLKVHMAVGADESALLEGLFDGAFTLVDGVTLTKTGLRIRLQSGNVIFSLVLSVSVDIGDKLLFTGEMAVEPNGVSMAATMQGDWHKPFGVNGLTLSDVALEVGISGEGIPTVGIAGKVQVKNLEGELAVLFNSEAPQQSALKLAFNEFYIKTVLELCDEKILDAIPDEFEVVLDSGYSDVEIYVVPTTTQIGELKYEQGFRAKGSVDILGWDAMTDMEIDPSEGITAIGEMDSLNLLNVLKLEGTEDQKNPKFDLELRLDKQKALIAGSVSFLGLTKYAVYANIGSKGAIFSIYEKLYEIVELALDNCSINKNGFSAAGNISFGIDSLGPIKVAGITIIHKIKIDTKLNMEASIAIDSGFAMHLNGSMEILGYSLPSINLNINAAPSDFKAVYNSLIQELESLISKAFNQIWKNVEEWANAVKDGVIEFSGDVASVAKDAFNASEQAAVAAYKVLDKGVDEIATGLKDVYDLGDDAVAGVLKEAGFAADEITSALKSVYGLGDNAVTAVLKSVGYGANEIAFALNSVYGLGDATIAGVLKGAGFAANEITSALKSVYGLSDNAVTAVLKSVGYGANEIASVLNSVYGLGDAAVAGVLKGAGYSADAVGGALKSAFNFSTEQAGKVLEGVGYAANQIKDWGGDAISWIGGTGETVGKAVKKIFHGW